MGIEFRNHNEIVPGEGLEHAPIFVGPVVSYSSSRFWATLTVLLQTPAIKGSTDGSLLVLDEHERVNARLLFGFHF